MEKMSWHQHIPINSRQGKQARVAEVSVKQLNTVISAKHRCKGKVGWGIRAEWPFLEGMMEIYCRGQGALRLQPCGMAVHKRAEEQWLRQDLASYCKTKAGACLGQEGKGEKVEEIGGCGFALAAQGSSQAGCPFSKPTTGKAWQCPHWSSWFPGQWLCWLPPCTQSPQTAKRDLPRPPMPPHHPALPTPLSPQELHCVNLKEGLDLSFLCCTKQGAEVLSIFCAELEKLVLTKCWRK